MTSLNNIALNAKVECTDGHCGTSTQIIIDPVSKKLTHLVVQEQWVPHTEYLVPIDQIVETSRETIRLAFPKAELKGMKKFVQTEFIETDSMMPYYGEDTMMAWPYTIPDRMRLPIEHERVPQGELAVHRGTYIQATDGPVGKVDEFLVDPDTGHITHLILRENHLWGRKVVALPLSTIDHTDDENVYLTIDKAAIGALPTIPVSRSYQLTDLDVIIFTFDETKKAAEALKTLKQAHSKKEVEFSNAAVLVKTEDGKTSVSETEDVSPTRGTIFGAITGGFVGLLGGPVGAIAGAVAGAATGRAAAKRIDMGFADEYLASLQDQLQPGNSALVVLAERQNADSIVKALAAFEGQTLRHGLTEDFVSHLSSETEE
ncbi:MAG: DUF1269 domain-containing protein [Anaerolineae bacterium]|nr:DUF1269 domain-containing protein [Anaerolineae bacterium]